MASYRKAINWIADYDDTGWLDSDEPIPSVTACLVADLFEKTDGEVQTDLVRAVLRRRKRKD